MLFLIIAINHDLLFQKIYEYLRYSGHYPALTSSPCLILMLHILNRSSSIPTLCPKEAKQWRYPFDASQRGYRRVASAQALQCPSICSKFASTDNPPIYMYVYISFSTIHKTLHYHDLIGYNWT